LNRVAIISDIHGNLPALQTVLEDIRARSVDALYCLGDLVGKGPQGDAVIDLCRETCDGVVKGNWDEVIAHPSDFLDAQWHQGQLGEERLNYLRDLPHTINLTMSGKRTRLYHASEKSVFTRVLIDVPNERRLAMFSNTEFTGFDMSEPDVVGYGDIHAAYVLPLSGKTLFNVGSVGNPLDEPLASYALLEGELDSNKPSDKPAPFSIQIVRIPYDIEAAIAVAKQMDTPELEPYAKELRTAVYRGRQS